MHTNLGFQVTVGKVPVEFQRGGLDAGAIAFLHFYLLHAIAVLLPPHDIHPHEHLRPVLAFRTAGPGIHVQYSAHLVLLAAQHIPEFQLFQQIESFFVLLIYFCFGCFAFFGEFIENAQIISCLLEFGEGCRPYFEVLYLP
jgi:hypothetical protein